MPLEAVGINMHPDREPDRASAERQFRLCRELGVTQARVAVEWATVEPERGRWDFAAMDRTVELAQAYGIELLEVLGYNAPWNTPIPGSTKTKPQDMRAFGGFVQRMAERYRGRIRAWEVWNEPNSDTFLAGPYAARPEQRWLDYAEILETAHRALKAADPGNVVVFGGLAHTSSHWGADLAACYVAGALRWCDVLAIHPYAGGHPERDPYYARYIDELLDVMAAQADSARPVWITEVGLPTSGHELAVSEAQQAANIEPTFRVALRRAQVKKVFYYALRDDGESFGLYRADGTPKPAAASLRDLCRRR